MWRFIRDESSGHFIMNSWAHSKKFLCSGPDGRIFTTENKEGTWEKWRIVSHPKLEGLRIESVEHHRFLSCRGKDLYTNEKEEKDTAWFLEPAHRNHFFISATSHDKRLSSSNELPFTSKNRKAWEKWIIEPTNEDIGQYTIRSMEHGKYLGSQEDDTIVVSEKKHLWTIGLSTQEGGGYLIHSTEHGRRLTMDWNGNLYIEEVGNSHVAWQLEPILPHALTVEQIWSRVGLAVTSVVDVAVIGVMGAKGFGACGTAATLQSFCTVGLGLAGVSIIGLVSLAATGFGNKDERVVIDEPEKYLPLCSWRLLH